MSDLIAADAFRKRRGEEWRATGVGNTPSSPHHPHRKEVSLRHDPVMIHTHSHEKKKVDPDIPACGKDWMTRDCWEADARLCGWK